MICAMWEDNFETFGKLFSIISFRLFHETQFNAHFFAFNLMIFKLNKPKKKPLRTIRIKQKKNKKNELKRESSVQFVIDRIHMF